MATISSSPLWLLGSFSLCQLQALPQAPCLTSCLGQFHFLSSCLLTPSLEIRGGVGEPETARQTGAAVALSTWGHCAQCWGHLSQLRTPQA